MADSTSAGASGPPVEPIRLGEAQLVRHDPTRGAQGREAALVDIAQDLLLRDLHSCGLMEELVFKGGTALRKLYAGNAGRFSLDLDFSVRDIGTDAEDVLSLLAEHVNGRRIGPFEYAVTERRGKRHLLMNSPELGSVETLSSKLDIAPPPWLEPITRRWVPMPVHKRYGGPPLPQLPVVRLEENLAEKISRLNRVTPARDMYDLGWIADNLLHSSMDLPLVRRMAVLKVWVDACGVTAGSTQWRPAHSGGDFDPQRWLRQRTAAEYDEEDIGVLAVPPPKLAELSHNVSTAYAFLARLDDDEAILARAQEKDRATALRLLEALPGGRLVGTGLR